MNDLISRQAAIDALNGLIDRFEQILRDIRETNGDDSVCGMCEYDGAYIGQSGDWCNECPGFDEEDCFKLSDKCRKRWLKSVDLPSAQPTIEERKTGKWVRHYTRPGVYADLAWHCSACGYATSWSWAHKYKFCPECGAEMEEGQDELTAEI